MNYSNTQLKVAVKFLAAAQGDIKERLLIAFNGTLHKLNNDDFPEDQKEEWKLIYNALTTRNGKTESVEEILRELDSEKCVEIAKMICILCFKDCVK
ncbi:MAG: hypothetical protein V5804_12170 [Mucilaginibacter sp.]|uniref:hypothetical protein n=1 Tax=Mucilaginibacter sp. TaxID=1882438 RepID=UPI0034E3EC32